MQTRIHLLTLALLFVSLFILTGCENYAEKTHQSWVTPPSGPVYDDSTISRASHKRCSRILCCKAPTSKSKYKTAMSL